MKSAKKKCSKCGGPGPFGTNRAEKDGLQKWCKPCQKQWAANHYKKNKKTILARTAAYRDARPEQYKEYERRSHERYPGLRLWRHARLRATRLNLPFDIKPADIVIPKKCPLLGVPLAAGKGKVGPASPTLDRMIPALGYVKGNIWVISHRANAVKNDASLAELELLTTNLRKHLKGSF